MHIALKVVIAFFALSLLLLGGIFLIAGGMENIITGVALVGIGFGLFAFIFFVERIEAKRPITQKVSVTMGGSGEFRDKEIKCPSCGAPVGENDITLISGGLMIKCPYCNSTSALEEEPKW
jgi:DNA-directed RNA polymerase subunit RPC12/RpoP